MPLEKQSDVSLIHQLANLLTIHRIGLKLANYEKVFLFYPLLQIESIRMGTTVATNALLERKGTKTCLVITAGFRDIVEIAQQGQGRPVFNPGGFLN